MSKPLNKTDLIKLVVADTLHPTNVVKDVVEAFLAAMAAGIQGDGVSINNFGSFTVRDVAAREGHNPKTMAPVSIPAKKRIKFKGAAVLRGDVR